jgi:tRNA (cmo5U34)-methyltransferase
MDQIKQHFEEEAQDFDRIILTLIPDYLRMLDALVAALPFERTASNRVIDLGCGTGTVAQRVLQSFPNAQVTCLDVAENMVVMAQTKLARYPNVRWLVGDFETFDGGVKYDAIVSSLALHHLVTDDDKRRFYHRIYGALDSGIRSIASNSKVT